MQGIKVNQFFLHMVVNLFLPILQEQHVIFCKYIIRRSAQGQIFNIWLLLHFTATAAGTVATAANATVGTTTAVVSAVVGDANVVAVVRFIVAMRT